MAIYEADHIHCVVVASVASRRNGPFRLMPGKGNERWHICYKHSPGRVPYGTEDLPRNAWRDKVGAVDFKAIQLWEPAADDARHWGQPRRLAPIG